METMMLLSNIILCCITAWYAYSTKKILKFMNNQSLINAKMAILIANEALTRVNQNELGEQPYREIRAKLKELKEIEAQSANQKE